MHAAAIYFYDKDAQRISSVATDGGAVESIMTNAGSGLLDPRGVAVDLAAGKVYFADALAQKIRRADLDGSNPEDLVTGLQGPSDIALDVAGGKIYWAERDANRIGRADLSGGNVTTVRSGVVQPYFLSLDVVAGMVYWGDFDSMSIHRASLDGSGSVENVVTGLQRGRDVLVDNEFIYVADRDARTISRKLLTTGTTEVLFNATDGLIRPHGLSIDPGAGMLYWTDTDARTVAKGRTDGVGTPQILASAANGQVVPWGIEVALPEPAGAVLLGVLGLAFFRRRRP